MTGPTPDDRRVRPTLQCLILAGGLGTRMREYDPGRPKALLEVAGRPFADWQLSWLAAGGVTSVVYSIGYKGSMIRDLVGDGARWGIEVTYVDDGASPLGTGGAIRLAAAEGALADRFQVLYGDSYLQVSPSDVDRYFVDRGLRALMTVFENRGRWDQSNVEYRDGLVVSYRKGRGDLDTEARYIDYGLSELDLQLVFERIPPDVPFDLADLMASLSREGSLGGMQVSDRFFEIGSVAGLHELEEHLAR